MKRWLQIHLSTAIVLMFAAGGLLWANIPSITPIFLEHVPESLRAKDKSLKSWRIKWQGWPICFWQEIQGVGDSGVVYNFRQDWTITERFFYADGKINKLFFLNILAIVVGASLLVWVCEYLIRRRQAQQEVAPQSTLR